MYIKIEKLFQTRTYGDFTEVEILEAKRVDDWDYEFMVWDRKSIHDYEPVSYTKGGYDVFEWDDNETDEYRMIKLSGKDYFRVIFMQNVPNIRAFLLNDDGQTIDVIRTIVK